MSELTPEEQDAVRQAVIDMRIEGFRISEERAMELVRQERANSHTISTTRCSSASVL